QVLTRTLAAAAAKRGSTIVSGFVPGIDMAAHAGALNARGITVGAVSDIPHYPALDYFGEHGFEAEHILNLNGAFVSEYGTKQSDEESERRKRVMARNRITTGLSDIVV